MGNTIVLGKLLFSTAALDDVRFHFNRFKMNAFAFFDPNTKFYRDFFLLI